MVLLLRLLPFLITLTIGAGGAGFFTKNIYETKIANMELAQQTKIAAEATSHADELRAAKSLGDVLTISLDDAKDKIQQLTLEKSRVIYKYSTGHVCLGGDLTRLLNIPFAHLTPDETGVPSATSLLDAENEAIATIETLTDGDVAHWIANAQGQYETCRQKYHALIEFNQTQQQQGNHRGE